MAIRLEVLDGVPWWASPDIWTVPGSPDGPRGLPLMGEPCYLWAFVHNRGDSAVVDAAVNFYWANPSVGFDRSTANFVGTSYVSLGPGDEAEVLCLTPWTPAFINRGHVCVLVEAFHSSLDPLPDSRDFSVPTDRHVAQRNVEIQLTRTGIFHVPFEIHNRGGQKQSFHIVVKQNKQADLAQLLNAAGVHLTGKVTHGKIENLALSQSACPLPDEKAKATGPSESVVVDAKAVIGRTVAGKLKGQAAVLEVSQMQNNQVVGGLTIVVLDEKAVKQ